MAPNRRIEHPALDFVGLLHDFGAVGETAFAPSKLT